MMRIMTRRCARSSIPDHRKLILAQLVSGLHDDHQWLVTSGSPADDIPDLIRLPGQRLG
jgi:hypothetical protein